MMKLKWNPDHCYIFVFCFFLFGAGIKFVGERLFEAPVAPAPVMEAPVAAD